MSADAAADCVFCGIVAQRIPATIVYRDNDATAFRDLNPQAPTHILVIPNTHITNTEALEESHDATVGALVRAASTIARQEGAGARGYRLVINTGADAGNTVPHLHLHLLAGRPLAWPPG